MKRSMKIAMGAVLVAVLGLIGATALAGHEMHNRGEHMKRRVSAFVDDALDGARISADQRTRIYAARDQVFATMGEHHKARGDRSAEMEEAIALFDADKLDGAKVAALRAKHEGEAKQMGDAVEQALTTVHDTLTAPQRKVVAAYVREHKPNRGGAGEWKVGMMKRFASSRIDAALDAVKATPAQKTVIEAARDHVYAAIEQNHFGAVETGTAATDATGAAANTAANTVANTMTRALALFEADQVAPSEIAALRAEHQAGAQKVGDAVVQALYDVHDALTPVQRRELTDYVRAQHAKWHRGGDDHPPAAATNR